jgi:hypothetical protein
VDAVRRVAPDVGIDAQLSNWAWVEGSSGTASLRYFDVTTPLLLDAQRRLALDVGIFLAAYPWAVRRPIARFVVPDLVDHYTSRRRILLDVVGNLRKERLGPWVPVALSAIQPHVAPGITEAEVEAFYYRDARLWSVLLTLRRADRWWQRRVRRRPYPFLLPGPIAR